MTVKVGFVGLGEMGKPMAANLVKKGFPLATCGHVSKGPVEELKSLGAAVLGSPCEVAEASDVIITMVRNPQQTSEVVRGEGSWQGRGVWQGVRRESVLMLCSTLEPGFCQALATAGKEKGVAVLDAPVSGGRARSEAGTLAFMVGGEKSAFERCRPVFGAMGTEIFYIGGAGMGQALKLVNNYMRAVTAFGTSEAIALGLKAGLDLPTMLNVIRVSTGNSSIVERYESMATAEKERARKAPGAPPLYKTDVALAIELAGRLGAEATLGKFILEMDPTHLFPTK